MCDKVLSRTFESFTISLTEHGNYNAEEQIIGVLLIQLGLPFFTSYQDLPIVQDGRDRGTDSMMGAQVLKVIQIGEYASEQAHLFRKYYPSLRQNE